MNKITIISGGTSGLGLQLAMKMMRSGRNVLILGRDKNRLNDALKYLTAENVSGTISGIQCNIGNGADVIKVENFLSSKSYTVEYLFNNAGKGLFMKINSTEPQMIDDIFEANLKGMILLTSSILKITPADSELTIVNIMSTSALYGRAEETIYCAAKWGARGYTEALRTELNGKKRNIIAVYPGGMRTAFWNMPGQNRDTSSYMDPADVADKIVNAVLVSDKMLVTDLTINRKK